MGGATSHTKKDAETLEDIAETRDDIAQFWYSEYLSRTRVYPQSLLTVITLPQSGVADTFGAWTQIIPPGTIPFNYHVHSLQTLGATAADTFFIQLAINAAPAGNQYLGEKVFALAAAGRARLDFACPTTPANTPVYGRVKTAGVVATINISLAVKRCLCSPDIITLLANKLTTWPW